jgi:hypothetical protein
MTALPLADSPGRLACAFEDCVETAARPASFLPVEDDDDNGGSSSSGKQKNFCLEKRGKESLLQSHNQD